MAGQAIPYKATVGSILIKNEKDEPEAMIYYTAYTKSDVKDMSQRPLAFVYNGGPGSSSLWLHMGSFGPKRVVTVNAGVTPPAPYKLEDNPNSLLDKADLVFIDPVGTGFSKAAGKAQDKDFWGVDSDARSLANFVQSYVSRNNRWNSPKFLVGRKLRYLSQCRSGQRFAESLRDVFERLGDDLLRLGSRHDLLLSGRRSLLHSLSPELCRHSLVSQSPERPPG